MKCKFNHILLSCIFLVILLAGCKTTSNSPLTNNQNENSISFIENKQEIKQQGYGLFGVSSLHKKNIKGDHIKIAILDTGVDLENNDLKVYKYKNFININENNVQDKNGHGTKIAGIISAQDNQSGLLGIAPNAEIYVGKVANDMGYVKSADLINGVRWAIEQKVDIINISLELYKDNEDLHNVIKEAYSKNIIIVASSGNQKDDKSKRVVTYPGAYDEVISVGMLNPEGKLSVYGFKDPKIKVYAPGEDIVSTYLKNKLTLDTATSFSTAYVSGYTALLIQEHRNKKEEYNQKQIIFELQSVFHKYMNTTPLINTIKTILNIGSLLLGVGLIGFLIYLIINFKKIKENKKDIKRTIVIGGGLFLLIIIFKILNIFLR